MTDRLLAALGTRFRRFTESGNPSVVLDPAALGETIRLRETAQPADDDPHGVPVDVLIALGYLHSSRYQALPEGHGQDDPRKALGFFSALMQRASERVPDDV